MTLLAPLLVVLAVAPVSANRVEYLATVTADPQARVSRRSIGDARYLSLGPLLDGRAFEILDLDKVAVIRVKVARAELVKRFGIIEPRSEVVSYTADRSVLLLRGSGTSSVTHWFVEIDNKTGGISRSVTLGDFAEHSSEFAGTNPKQNEAWFFSIEWHDAKSDDLVLRRLDLATFKVSIAAKVPRSQAYGLEMYAHVSGDFARFATVDHVSTDEPGDVVITSPSGSAFAVPAPTAGYGLAFSPDGKHAYVASSDRGTIARVDLAKRRTDRTVSTLRGLHHLVVSPDGTQLYVMASSESYAVYDLPALSNRNDRKHDPKLSRAMGTMFGGGAASADRRYFVIAITDPSSSSTAQQFAISRFVK